MQLSRLIEQGNYYQGYTYAYPHKTAYRPFDPIPLQTLWAQEQKQNLFLYVHIPFCEMRCGFCNLFTTTHPSSTLSKQYLDALQREVNANINALGNPTRYAQFALGGGTPTYLEAPELQRLFDILLPFNLDYASIESSVETSPLTATPDRLSILKAHHVKRISMGVQSFEESEVRSVGRTQKNEDVFRAIENIRHANFPLMNLDLIYGMAHQSPTSWKRTITTALQFQPEELFLYPLYVRPLTGIGKFGRTWDDERQQLYRIAREHLLNAGYEQVSMRYFRKHASPVAHTNTSSYSCQQDGMVGLGCGARSYTRGYHYSGEYAVKQQNIKAILNDYTNRSELDFSFAKYGFIMDLDTQKRRFILQSILHGSGLSLSDYQARFTSFPLQDFPELQQLFDLHLATEHNQHWTLTAHGLELSDLIGPWFYDHVVQQRIKTYALN